MGASVRPESSGSRIERTVAALRQQGATEHDIETYLTQHEGLTPIAAPRDATRAPLGPRPKGQSIGQALTGAAEQMNQGATFGFSDEIGALVGGLIANPRHPLQHFDQLRKQITQTGDQFASEHPVLAMGANLAGGLEGGLTQGAVAGAMRGAPAVAEGGSKMLRLAKALGSGAAVGGVAAAGSADGGVDDRLKAVPTGAAYGAGAVLGMKGAGGVARATGVPQAVQRLLPRASGSSVAGKVLGAGGVMTTEDLAKADVLKQLQRARVPLSELETRAATAHPDQMLVNIGGDPLVERAGGAYSVPSRGAADLRAALEAQDQKLPTVAKDAASKALGVTRHNTVQTLDQMMADRASAARPLYEQAYKAPPISDRRILSLFQDPTFQEAHDVARRLAKGEGVELPPLTREVPALREAESVPPSAPVQRPSLRDALSAFENAKATAAQRSEGTTEQQIARAALDRRSAEAALPAAPPKVTAVPQTVEPPTPGEDFAPVPLQAFDYMKRSLDDVIERKMNQGAIGRAEARQLRSRLDQALRAVDEQAPEYQAARAKYAGDSRAMEAHEMGKNFMRESSDELAAMWPTLTEPEREFYRKGAIASIEDAVAGKTDGLNPVRPFRNDLVRQKLAIIAPSGEAAADFNRTVEQIHGMKQNANSILANSKTASRLAQQDEAAGDVGTVAKTIYGGPASLVNAVVNNALSRRIRGLSEAQVNALAPLLTAHGDELTQVIQKLKQLQLKQASRRPLLPRTAAQIAGASSAKP